MSTETCTKLFMPANSYSMRRCTARAVVGGYCKRHIPVELRGEPKVVLYGVSKYCIEPKDAIPFEVNAYECNNTTFRNEHGTIQAMENAQYIYFTTLHKAIHYSATHMHQRREQALKQVANFDAGIEALEKFRKGLRRA